VDDVPVGLVTELPLDEVEPVGSVVVPVEEVPPDAVVLLDVSPVLGGVVTEPPLEEVEPDEVLDPDDEVPVELLPDEVPPEADPVVVPVVLPVVDPDEGELLDDVPPEAVVVPDDVLPVGVVTVVPPDVELDEELLPDAAATASAPVEMVKFLKTSDSS